MPPSMPPSTPPLDVLFVDNHILAVNKPPGLLTQPSGTTRDNLEDRAKAWIKATYDKPGNVFLEAVHRIDAPVSGVVLFGRTSKSLTRLNAAVRERRVAKTYLAVVRGRPAQAHATIVHHLLHDDHHARVVPPGTPGAAPARLAYTVEATRGDRSLLRIDLETGRYHQIRVQLATLGHPIVGDTRYGGPPFPAGAGGGAAADGRIALHHERLVIPHPVGGDSQTFVAPVPVAWPW